MRAWSVAQSANRLSAGSDLLARFGLVIMLAGEATVYVGQGSADSVSMPLSMASAKCAAFPVGAISSCCAVKYQVPVSALVSTLWRKVPTARARVLGLVRRLIWEPTQA